MVSSVDAGKYVGKLIMQSKVNDKFEEPRRKFSTVLELNEDHLIDEISPIYGLEAMAEKKGMDFEVVLVRHGQNILGQATNESVPSIMETAFRDDRRADEACPDPDIQAHEIYQEDQRADAAFDEAFPESFWADPDDNVLPFENTQTAGDKMLTAKQVALELFNNDCEAARAILYTKEMRRKLGAYSRGKGCKVFYPESKVLAYKAKQPKRSQGFAMYLPEHAMDRSKSKKLDA